MTSANSSIGYHRSLNTKSNTFDNRKIDTMPYGNQLHYPLKQTTYTEVNLATPDDSLSSSPL